MQHQIANHCYPCNRTLPTLAALPRAKHNPADVRQLLRTSHPELALPCAHSPSPVGQGRPAARFATGQRPPALEAHHTGAESRGRRQKKAGQASFVLADANDLSTREQQYDPTSIINEVRGHVERWRDLPNPSRVAGDAGDRAAAPALAAPRVRRRPPVLLPGRGGRDGHLADRGRARSRAAASGFSTTSRGANKDANPELLAPRAEARHRRRQDHRHGDADRLADGQRRAPPEQQALHPRLPRRRARPHDQGPAARPPAERPGQLLRAAASWCPTDMLDDIDRAKIVITNYHAFKLRETHRALEGRPRAAAGPRRRSSNTLETEGQMLQRVMPDLMGMKNILVLNDEAHHCYREKPQADDDEELKGDDKKEAEKNNEAARLWISGLEAVNRKLGVARVYRPVGHAVLPARLRLRRGHAVPVDDERLLADGRDRVRHRQAAARAGRRQHPRRRDADVPQPLGAHRQGDAEEGARQGRRARPARACPTELQTALEALYGHYEKTFELWEERRHRRAARASSSSARTPRSRSWSTTSSPASSATNEDGATTPVRTAGSRCSATSTSTATASPGPNTLLIDSEQLEAGDALDDDFRDDGRRRDRALPARDRRAHRRPPRRPRTSPTRTCCAR